MAAFTREDREILVAARFAEMKAALQLNNAQEKQWSAVEAELHSIARARAARRAEVTQMFVSAAKAGRTPEISVRLSEYAKGLRSRADQVEKLANASKPLLGSLDENQSRRFGLLLSRSRRRRARAKEFGSFTRYVNRLISEASSKP